MGEFDRSIFMRLKWLVLVHLRYVSLVILVLYASFVCFQVLRGLGSKKVHFEAIWSIFGHGLDSLSMEPRGWTNLKALYALEDTTHYAIQTNLF